jgi:hypothetical protein
VCVVRVSSAYTARHQFPEPVNRILLRQRFLSSPDLEHSLESLRDKDDELVVQKWLEGNSVCCSRSKTGFCYCGKEPKEVSEHIIDKLQTD